MTWHYKRLTNYRQKTHIERKKKLYCAQSTPQNLPSNCVCLVVFNTIQIVLECFAMLFTRLWMNPNDSLFCLKGVRSHPTHPPGDAHEWDDLRKWLRFKLVNICINIHVRPSPLNIPSQHYAHIINMIKCKHVCVSRRGYCRLPWYRIFNI